MLLLYREKCTAKKLVGLHGSSPAEKNVDFHGTPPDKNVEFHGDTPHGRADRYPSIMEEG